ncbi:MAG: energy transducer TonB [Prolixibacteraceae bacterium]|nr:energy transducer TonB [Prolixibacteraceae bacterium]MBN2650413.1 energy transducer TonB [Prolixibacteraceae bacterium]
MELKKTLKADLENKRNIFIQIGLVVSLGIVLSAFSFNSTVKPASSLGDIETQEIEDEHIQVTRQDEIKPPPPPPPPKVVELIVIVENNVDIDEEFEFISTEVDDKTIIDAVFSIKDELNDEDDDVPFTIVEKNPEFPGGDLALLKYISDHIDYPAIAIENGIQGKVFVKFVVEKDGSISNATIIRGVDPSLDKEALRVINSLPKWKPGEQRGKPVKVFFNMPINFQLQ